MKQLGSSDFLTPFDKKYKRNLKSSKSIEKSPRMQSPINKKPKTEMEIYSLLNDTNRFPLIPSVYFNENLTSPNPKEVKINIENTSNDEQNAHGPSSAIYSMKSPTIRLAKFKSRLNEDSHFIFGIEDGKMTKILMERWKMTELIISFFVVFSIATSVLEYEVEFENEENDNRIQEILCWCSTIITTILIGLTIIRRKWVFLLKEARKYLNKKHYIGNTTELFYLIVEILILLPHPTPFTQDYFVEFKKPFKQHYKLNEIFNLCLLLRVYIIARFSIIASTYYGNRAHRTCQFYAVTPSYFFSGKCMLKSRPYLIISLSILSVILLCGQAIRICESPLLRYVHDPEQIMQLTGGMDLRDYQNDIWLLCITISTVGYGDYYPRTSLGRLVIILVSVFGMITTSLIVATFQNELGLTTLEKNVYNTMERLEVRDFIKEKARNVIKYIVRFNKISKTTKKFDKITFYKVKKSLIKFRNAQRLYRALSDETYSVAEDLAKYFIEMEEKIKNLTICQKLIRKEIRNTGTEINSRPRFFNFGSQPSLQENTNNKEDSTPLSMIKEESFENFLADAINEKKKLNESPEKHRHTLKKP